MKKLLYLFLSMAVFNIAVAQKKSWSVYSGSEKISTDKAVSRSTFPKSFKLYNLDLASLRADLFEVVSNASRHTTIISLPNADGEMEQFEVVEASNFEPALQVRFPEIRAFSGKGLTDRYATLKLSYSTQGIQTTVFRAEKPTEYMEPYSADHSVYAVFRSYRPAGQLPWNCQTPDEKLTTELNAQVMNLTARSGGDLKTMRLAQSCNAEYSNYFGATSAAQVGLVLAAFNNTLTRCNGIYEKDLALHLNLIATTTNVIYYNPSTDPYTTQSSWNSQLQSTLNSVIGAANYDIGHMFGSNGGGGNAGCIGCFCNDANKGSGITSPADGIPQGDNFDIDYVAHEVGHQLGGNHTFSQSNEGTGVNKEPGSGITIMGYAGITAQDMANHSIDIFHQTTIAQIQANFVNKTCPVTTPISANNATPVVAAVSNYTIPRSTPFALTGSATDANGDGLTYCWEQNDNAGSTQTGASSVASATKATGPNWITFLPTSSPTRLFPRLSTILAGGLITGPLTGGDANANSEALSSVARTLNFRLTVRDNAPYSSTAPVKVGQTQFRDMVVTVNGTAGPFAVSSPNTAVTYAGGSTQTITWSVNSTNLAPINCAKVKITLSTDGGLTFPIVLSDSTANDGTEALVIPSVPTTTARVKIEAVGNIFFDISNTNFTINGAVACGDATGLASSAIGNNAATISWNAVNGAISYAVDYKLNSSATWISFATAQAGTTANLTGLTQGSLYDYRVRATCNAGSGNFVSAQFTTTAPFVCNAPAGLTATAITSSAATLNWTAVGGAASYLVQYKLNTDTTWITAAAASITTTVNISGLAASSLYNYRVSTNCGANGTSGFTSAQFSTTAPFVCNAPTGLTATAITSSGATISWTAVAGAASYAVEYKLNSAATWTTAAAAATTTSVSVTGLTASSLYDCRVSTNCGTNGTSGFTSAQFTTIAASVCGTAFEPNETTATAAVIVSGATNSAAITTATDNDYFRITTTATSNIVYSLVGPSGVDFDITIFNSAGNQLSTATGSTATETITLNNQAAGTYFIRVFGFNGALSATCYTIRATATTVTSCQNTKDTSTNNTIAGAAVIPFNTNITGRIDVGSDVDHYRFTITRAGTISLSLTTLPANFNLRLVNSANTVLSTSSNNGTTSEAINNYSITPGTYYARVYPTNTSTFNTTSCYTVRVSLGTAARMQEFASADIEAFPNPAQNQLNLKLNGFDGTAEIGIYSVNGTLMLTRKSTTGTSTIDVSSLPSGVYMINVKSGKALLARTKFVKY